MRRSAFMLVASAVLSLWAAGFLAATSVVAQDLRDEIEVASDFAAPRSVSSTQPSRSGVGSSESLRLMHLQRREEVAAKAVNEPLGALSAFAPLEQAVGAPPRATRGGSEAALRSALGATALPPQDIVVGLNRINTINPTAGTVSTLGEPAHVNVGSQVFYTGNTFASFTSNTGVTWGERTFPTPLNAGETVCCDQDVEYSQGRNTVFWSMLFLNATGTVGTVTIAVLPSPNAAPSCLYDFTFGANVVPDYPHLGLSNDSLYLNTNNLNTAGTANTADDTWVGSQMLRFPLDEMAACQGFGFSIFTWNGPSGAGPQRLFVPVEGATDVMYWGILDNNTTFRIFDWPESSNSVSNVTRTISSSPQNNPDCRGGANNTDWIQRGTAFSLTGFRVRGWTGQANGGGGRSVVGWLWNAGTTAGFPQAHVRAAVFDRETKDLIGQPHIFNPSFCFGFPDVAVTERGHPAIVLGVGGQNGGGGSAVSSAILLGDDTISGGGPFGPFTTVAAGTHNPANQRFGDYFTMQQLEPCDMFMTASSYALNGGTAAANVEHHYTIFGRNRDLSCFDKWNPPIQLRLPFLRDLPVFLAR
jgi:hypothetical protein